MKNSLNLKVMAASLLTAMATVVTSLPAQAQRVIIVDEPPHSHRPLKHHHPRNPPPRTRHYRSHRIVRHYGPRYYGYAYFYSDDDAYKYLAFTAITLKLLDNLNEEQQRRHEAAQVQATRAGIGDTIVWHDGGASGAVTTVREGTSSAGLPCREFQQTITVGGTQEQGYGTACLQADGSWRIVDTR